MLTIALAVLFGLSALILAALIADDRAAERERLRAAYSPRHGLSGADPIRIPTGASS